MAYKVPAKVIRTVLIWGFGEDYYTEEAFFKTIRKQDLFAFYYYYGCKDIGLTGNKQEMFILIKICFAENVRKNEAKNLA